MSEGKYKPHSHRPRNVNSLHQEEHESSGINQRVAVGITKATGTMACAYLFLLLALLGFPALSAWLGSTVAIYVVWISQTLIQLCMLPILSVGQSVISRKQELQADEEFEMTEKICYDQATIIKQNNEIIEQNEKLIRQSDERDQAIQKQFEVLAVLLTPPVASRRSRARKQEVDET